MRRRRTTQATRRSLRGSHPAAAASLALALAAVGISGADAATTIHHKRPSAGACARFRLEERRESQRHEQHESKTEQRSEKQLSRSCASQPAPSASGIHKIRHVVIIMQENRSFDTYFGAYPGADGIPGLAGHPGKLPCVPDPRAGGCQKPFLNTRTSTPAALTTTRVR